MVGPLSSEMGTTFKVVRTFKKNQSHNLALTVIYVPYSNNRNSGCRVQGLGFSVQRSGSRVQGSKFRVQDAGIRVQGAGCRVQGSGSKVQCAVCRVQGSGLRAQGAGCRVQGAGFRVQGLGHLDRTAPFLRIAAGRAWSRVCCLGFRIEG